MTSLKHVWSDKRLTRDTKLRIYQTIVLSVLLYAADTWTLLSADVRTVDAFHQKCLSRLLGIQCYDRVRNDKVLQRTGLTSLSHLLSRRCVSVFGHVPPLDDDTPANIALQLHIDVSLDQPLDCTWRHPPGRPQNKWLDCRFHLSDWRLLEACCQLWTWWCNDATALAGCTNMMMMMMNVLNALHRVIQTCFLCKKTEW